MSDLFDLPFEDEESSVDSPQSPVPSRQSTVASPQSTVPSRQSTVAGPQLPAVGGQSRGSGATSTPEGSPPAWASSARAVLTVTELTVRIRDLIESEFLEVWVEGELSNCKAWNTGHLYFTLKDAGAQVRGVIFRSVLRYLKFKPGDGLRVIARGRVSVYEPKGEYQLVCEHMEPHGLGALQLAFEQLKKRLQAEGLFDLSRKRALPALPRKIGIVTSLEGAAIRDIINVLRRRYANAHLVIRPARVQGDGASLELTRALQAIGRLPGVDVVIIGRGGGSIEDLWAFNDERLARAIANSPVPVIAAVGHESDVTIADFVADLRAPTPSAAAEMVVARKDEFWTRIDHLADRLAAAARARIHALSRAVHALSGRAALSGYPGRLAMAGRHTAELTHALAHAVGAGLAARLRRLDHLRRQLDSLDVGRRLGGVRARLLAADRRLEASTTRAYHRADARLRGAASRLDALSPLAVLGRGYAVCWTADGARVVRAAADVHVGDSVRVTLAKGALSCEVRETKP